MKCFFRVREYPLEWFGLGNIHWAGVYDVDLTALWSVMDMNTFFIAWDCDIINECT